VSLVSEDGLPETAVMGNVAAGGYCVRALAGSGAIKFRPASEIMISAAVRFLATSAFLDPRVLRGAVTFEPGVADSAAKNRFPVSDLTI